MADGYASSLIQSLRGNVMPSATVGDAGVTELQFPWMNTASMPLRQRVAPAVALKNPEKLQFTQHTPRDPTPEEIDVAKLLDENKHRVVPIDTGNPVFNLEQNLPAGMRQPLQEFAFIGPTEFENKLMPAPGMESIEPPAPPVEEAPPPRLDPRDYRLQAEPQPMFAGLLPPKEQPTPVMEAPTMRDEIVTAMTPSEPTMPPPARQPPLSALPTSEAVIESEPDFVLMPEAASPMQLDLRDYRLQEEPQPMFAGLVPPSQQPQPIMEAPTLREEIMAAMAEQEAPAPEPVVEPLQFSDAELEMLVAMLEEEGRG